MRRQHQTKTMPFKFNADGSIALADVNGAKLPVFVHPDGKEAPFDADTTIGTISRLNGEAKSHRERAEKAESTLKAFEGITDPGAALKALSVVKNLDDKKLVDAGEVERVKAEVLKSVQAQYEPIVKKAETLERELYGEKIGGAFARSKFIADKVAVPADLLQASFGRHFSIEGGKVIAKDANGNQLFSRTKHGEPADFEEALEMLVDAYPHKASILKGSNASGSGAASSGAGGGGKKTITRAQFAQLSPAEQKAAASTATFVD
jgi:hypothetical protein